MTRSEIRRVETLLREARQHGYTRRQLVARAAAMGIALPSAGLLFGGVAGAQDAEPAG
jgi:hypothetical protein